VAGDFFVLGRFVGGQYIFYTFHSIIKISRSNLVKLYCFSIVFDAKFPSLICMATGAFMFYCNP
jgi:hypothetical protein